MTFRILLLLMTLSVSAFAQLPPIEAGVSQELAKWRAARYSDVRYKLNLTLEKMSPVLKGTIEIRVKVGAGTLMSASPQGGETGPIILDWRKIKGHDAKSTISNVLLNGKARLSPQTAIADKSVRAPFEEHNEHLIFSDGVVMGENVIKLDFTSPILPSGSAITRYVDKEDGSEYLYSLFVPSDASTAFPVFDQPDIKARFELEVEYPNDWLVVANSSDRRPVCESPCFDQKVIDLLPAKRTWKGFAETKPISTYVFAFAAGPFEKVSEPGAIATGLLAPGNPVAIAPGSDKTPPTSIYVRKTQLIKFKPHAEEVFRLNRGAVKYFEEYFDYKFPFPKYDLVLIPEFPFGGMEHAGATFLREASIIFPQEPTKNDHISRATLIFHEAAHQWFGDTVTMRWFDDLWLKEGFATFTAYKALEKIMPSAHAWKVFYERVKQAAYQTDSTKGTTPIYQEIKNLSAAKSAYGNIVYNKAPAFLRQAEFYLGEDKFQAAVRAFLKKHGFGNAGWEDLVSELEVASKKDLSDFAQNWVKRRGLPLIRAHLAIINPSGFQSRHLMQENRFEDGTFWTQTVNILTIRASNERMARTVTFQRGNDKTWQLPIPISDWQVLDAPVGPPVSAVIPNYQDYGYGIFLLDEKSREYVLKNIRNEKDPFLRSMMWGALWDSVREGELDPREFVELVVRVLMQKPARTGAPAAASAGGVAEQGLNAQVGSQALANARASASEDESTTALLLNRVGTAMNYYIDDRRVAGGTPAAPVGARVEEMLIAGMRNSATLGQRITYYRAFLNIVSSEKARGILKGMLKGGSPSGSEGAPGQRGGATQGTLPTGRVSASITLKTKDKFDIVTRLMILGDPDAPKLLADLEKTETGDDAKRYAYAAKAGIGTAENKAKYWNDFVNNQDISESWIEAAFGPWNSIRHSGLTLPYLQKALQELPNHKRSRKIFFVNGWLGAFIGGQRSEEALAIVNKFLSANPNLDNDLRLKILENVDIIERAVRIRGKYPR